MDNKTFINTLAERCGRDTADIRRLTDGLAAVLRERCGSLSAVAIPAFGTFRPEKTDERIAVDPASGKTMLYPPQITITFTAGSMLKKHIRHD